VVVAVLPGVRAARARVNSELIKRRIGVEAPLVRHPLDQLHLRTGRVYLDPDPLGAFQVQEHAAYYGERALRYWQVTTVPVPVEVDAIAAPPGVAARLKLVPDGLTM
jgi:hypothetical protein